MKFNYINFKNFLSFGDETQSVDLSKEGIILVIGKNLRDGGSNGAGKSTCIVDTITYALYGKTTKKLNAEDIINNINKKDCYVELSFTINKDEYLIRRYRSHSDFGNLLTVHKNGNNISLEKAKDTQSLLESIIKINYQSFVSSIVLSQEKISNFAESDETDRKKVIENLLMYDFISKYHKTSKVMIRRLRPTLEAEKSKLKNKKETIEALTKNLFSYIENFEKKEEQKESRRNEIKLKLKEYKSIDVEKELDIRNKVQNLKNKKSSLEGDIESLEESIENNNGRLSKLKNKISQKEEELSEIEENPDKCPVCGTIKKDSDNIKKFIKSKKDEIDEIKNSIRDITNKNEDSKIKLKECKGDLTKLNEEIKRTSSSVNINFTDKEISDIQDFAKDLESELKLLNGVVNIEEDEFIIKSKDQIRLAKEEAKKTNKKIKRMNEEYSHLMWWREALGNSQDSLKSFCINYILQSLNKYINYYLKFFNFDIEYKLNEELKDTIFKNGIEYKFNQLSGGEKRSVEISLVFALYEVVRLKMQDKINVIVLDELLSWRLDDVRIDSIMEILSELESRNLLVFVIDHKNSMRENLTCKTMTIIKDKNEFSSIEITN